MKNKSYAERTKVNASFYRHLIVVFVVTCICCFAVLGFEWMWLTNYEKSTPEGVMNIYLKDIKDEKFDKIYDESQKVFYQFNDIDTYTNFLKEKYQHADIKKAGYSKLAYSNEEFSYYDVIVDGNLVSNLQVRKVNHKYYARTNFQDYNYFIDVFNGDKDLKINGVDVSDANYSAIDVESFLTLNTNYPNGPIVNRLYFDNILEDPTVTSVNSDSIVIKDISSNVFYVGDKPATDNIEIFEEYIYNAATTYCKYITKDALYYQIRNLLLPNTVFQEALSTFENTWFTDHDSIEFENVEIYDIMEFDEGFIGTISFDYIVSTHDVTKAYNSIYQLTFKEVNNKYLVSNLKIGG